MMSKVANMSWRGLVAMLITHIGLYLHLVFQVFNDGPYGKTAKGVVGLTMIAELVFLLVLYWLATVGKAWGLWAFRVCLAGIAGFCVYLALDFYDLWTLVLLVLISAEAVFTLIMSRKLSARRSLEKLSES